MKKMILAAMAALLMLTGCVTGWSGPKPLSRRWASERRQEAEIAQRRERIGKPLFGGARTTAKDGAEPRALIGSENGLGAELKGLKSGVVRYRIRW